MMEGYRSGIITEERLEDALSQNPWHLGIFRTA